MPLQCLGPDRSEISALLAVVSAAHHDVSTLRRIVISTFVCYTGCALH